MSNAEPLSPWRWWVCGLLLLATTLNYMDRMALTQLAGPIKKAFQLNNEAYGTIESGFSIAFAVGTLSAGWLVDRVSVRWVYPALVLGWSIAGFMTGYAVDFWSLLAFRVALGLFEAGNWPCGIRTTRQVLPPNERSFGNSLFQSGTAIGAIITPLIVIACLQFGDSEDPDYWRLPFRIIGLTGLIWIVGWVWLATPQVLNTQTLREPAGVPTPFRTILRDPRFLLLVLVIIAVNTSWHTFRLWMPLYLTKQQGYSQEKMNYFMVLYYLCADVGSWTVGLLTLFMARKGVSLDRARIRMYGVCAFLVAASLGLLVVEHPAIRTALLLLYGFGALGLFPTYFSLSQELSSQHQGKVTGTLGFINAIYLAGMYRLEGRFLDWSHDRYDWLLAFAGLPALGVLVVLARRWPTPPPHNNSPT